MEPRLRGAMDHCGDPRDGSGVLVWSDLRVTTRLLLGMAIWVSRWYRPSEGFTAEELADAAIQLI
ncbi:hypothetical protein [Rhodococcus sp. Leaf278]|uniref:hypothetical protein n=1 Tax=Rhodococcus sp. Leaf278 TaxID=1736319 RepID=UPI0012E3DE50|nr:hypothetical protein [Rhodococcus sp. Leaf278]